jgi:hypothetical protein
MLNSTERAILLNLELVVTGYASMHYTDLGETWQTWKTYWMQAEEVTRTNMLLVLKNRLGLALAEQIILSRELVRLTTMRQTETIDWDGVIAMISGWQYRNASKGK